ncbi:methyltransferase domain-containing protein [Planctomycetota bacterium]
MSEPRRLNLGCGTALRSGYVNLDVLELPGVDVVHDLRVLPWPFEDDSFEEVFAFHVLEHLPDTVKVMEEIWRILAPDGILDAEVPHARSVGFLSDPTHAARFTEKTFNYFTEESPERPESSYNFYSHARFEIVSLERLSVRYPRFLGSKKLFKWFVDARLEIDAGAVSVKLRKAARCQS